MVSLISALLISMVAPAETLELTQTQYFAPTGSPSCGLLHQRDLERQKVMRELSYLFKSLKQNERALVPLDNLLTNKLFMPKDTWMDDSVEVAVSAAIPDDMQAEITQIGLANVFIRTDAPGFVWQSLAAQIPEDVSILQFGNQLIVRYKTYLNSSCESPLRAPTVEWIRHEDVAPMVNSLDVVTKMRTLL